VFFEDGNGNGKEQRTSVEPEKPKLTINLLALNYPLVMSASALMSKKPLGELRIFHQFIRNRLCQEE
jgi:hypothetical protein